MLGKLTIDHLRLKQFNPSKFIGQADDDQYFLSEYGGKARVSSRLEAKERQSLSIVESTRMRASEIERQDKMKEINTERRSKNTKLNF